MKITAADIARALVKTSKDLPAAQLGEAAAAAMEMLRRHGLSKDVRTFPRVARRMMEKEGTVFAELVLPSDDGADALVETLARGVSLTRRADPSILGGALLSVGDERFDASVKGSLERLRLQFIGSAT